MLAFAKREFALSERLDDGSTQREHGEVYFRATGKYHAGLEPLDCPFECHYLWAYWVSMSGRRQNFGFGPVPLSQGEVEAWQRRRNVQLEPFEQEAIDLLEQLFFATLPKPKGK